MLKMRYITICVAFTSGAMPVQGRTELAAATPDCSYDSNLLSTDIEAFDQNMDGGWRKIASQPGCEKAAADAIKLYRETIEKRMGTLFWHEAQMRATAGDSIGAIPLMQRSRKPDSDIFGWNAYVDASIAFLAADRNGLIAARDRLAQTPEPQTRNCVDTNGKKIGCSRWPGNLDVVDGLIACFGKPYSQAYGPECRGKESQPNK